MKSSARKVTITSFKLYDEAMDPDMTHSRPGLAEQSRCSIADDGNWFQQRAADDVFLYAKYKGNVFTFL